MARRAGTCTHVYGQEALCTDVLLGPSYCRVVMSHCSFVMLWHCRVVVLLRCRTVAQSHSHVVVLSYCHVVVLSR